ncbi:FMN-linked oxidoreductase [Suillus subluteus]|nr:FMN-linked oxidoreductase [Suillus subluteus]
MTFHNCIFVSPISAIQYFANDGHLTSWHMAHRKFMISSTREMLVVFTVVPEGRITPDDAEPLRKIIGIQLAHAGRKAPTVVPWLKYGQCMGPSFDDAFAVPKELSKTQIKAVVVAFVEVTKRALKAGIEIHSTHGYLLFSFLSPNRVRLILEVVDAICDVMPEDMPLFFQIASNEPSWRVKEWYSEHDGVDSLDVSSGASHPKAIIKASPAYQAPFTQAVKQVVGVVGSITDGKAAQEILDKGQADVVLVGRLFQKNPGTVGVKVYIPHEIS